MENQKPEINESEEALMSRRPWLPMHLTYLGQITELVQGGPGKCTTTGGDPGEGRKQKGADNTCT